VRLSLIVLKVKVKEEIHELLISDRKCALREIGAQIKLYVLQWTSGHLAKRLPLSLDTSYLLVNRLTCNLLYGFV